LTPLRFHRFDAHARAWRAAGLSVEQAQALTPGPLRDQIEDQTNAGAAAPYTRLDAQERAQLLEGLAGLPT
jgi:hypothetical protein